MENRHRFPYRWMLVAPLMAISVGFFLSSCSPSSATTPAPSFELTNQQGETVSLSQFRGQVVALTFLYVYCPDTCPLYVAKIHQAMASIPTLQDKVAIVVITVDPDRDTPEILRTYTKGWPANWHYLTGTPSQLKTVWENYSIFVQKKEGPEPASHEEHGGYEVIHTAKVVLIDTQGNKATELKGDWEAPGLAQKLEALAAGRLVSGPSLAQAAVGFLYNCGSVAFQNLGQAVTHAVVTLSFLGGLAAIIIMLWR